MTGGAYREPRTALTPQERSILRALAEGWTDKEIASELGINVHRVMSRIATMRANHRALNRTHLVSIAYRKGLFL